MIGVVHEQQTQAIYPQFKARLALEAVRGEKTVSELSSQYSIHPSLINNFKRQLLEGASEIFESGTQQAKSQQDHQTQIAELFR
jgi:transposase-like protein